MESRVSHPFPILASPVSVPEDASIAFIKRYSQRPFILESEAKTPDPMRKLLEIISLMALAMLLWMSLSALYGADHLQDKIPTHFDLAGNPNAWGSSQMLLLLPGVGIFLYLTISLVSFFPGSFNYPVRVSAQNRERLQSIALNMMAFLKAETLCLLALLQYYTLQAARSNRLGLPPFLMLIAIAVVFVTMGSHIAAMRRAR
jgi:hypothetical protein